MGKKLCFPPFFKKREAPNKHRKKMAKKQVPVGQKKESNTKHMDSLAVIREHTTAIMDALDSIPFHCIESSMEKAFFTEEVLLYSKVNVKFVQGAVHTPPQKRSFARTVCGMSDCSLPRFHKGHCNSMTFTTRKRPMDGIFRERTVHHKRRALNEDILQVAQDILSFSEQPFLKSLAQDGSNP